jgi:hypothetical protein
MGPNLGIKPITGEEIAVGFGLGQFRGEIRLILPPYHKELAALARPQAFQLNNATLEIIWTPVHC